jgi:hypothetical protein
MLCTSMFTLPRPLKFTSLLQYKFVGFIRLCDINVVQSHCVVLQFRSQKEQFRDKKSAAHRSSLRWRVLREVMTRGRISQ